MKFVELNHVIEDGMEAFPGFPRPNIDAWLDHAALRPRYQQQAEFHISRVSMVGNTCTYLDSPFHWHRDGADLS